MRDMLLGTSYVDIVATTDEDSYTIFEILNARGQELEDHELVKNFVMRYIQPQEQAKVDKVKSEWELYIDRLLGTSVKRFSVIIVFINILNARRSRKFTKLF